MLNEPTNSKNSPTPLSMEVTLTVPVAQLSREQLLCACCGQLFRLAKWKKAIVHTPSHRGICSQCAPAAERYFEANPDETPPTAPGWADRSWGNLVDARRGVIRSELYDDVADFDLCLLERAILSRGNDAPFGAVVNSRTS